ncbi:YfdX family protein [Duganella sp. CT11-25]|uniref:YfdX family protein n=1 Tax=unclassified Duganella TaxID=2636909 RepID=UPI0039AF3755
MQNRCLTVLAALPNADKPSMEGAALCTECGRENQANGGTMQQSLNRNISCAVLFSIGLMLSPSGGAIGSLPPRAEPQGQANRSVQPEIDKRTAEMSLEKQGQLIAEAQSAVAETERALRALNEKKNSEALDALAVATGKLELILARNPKLALAPVRTDVITHDLFAKIDTVKAAVNEARNLLSDGEIQKARQLIEGLGSEIEYRTLNIPLATYPAAIKSITPLIDAGKVDEAKAALQTMLNTLVITTEVVPLPKLRAEEQIKAAQALADKKGRTKEEDDKLAQSIQGAREQIRMGETLGYGSKQDYKPMYQQIDEIEKRSAGGKSRLGWVDKIKRQLAQWTGR